jgi:hypothetical protein
LRNPILITKPSILFVALLALTVLGIASVSRPDPGPTPTRRAHTLKPTPVPTPIALPDGVAEPPLYKMSAPRYHDGEKLVYEASWAGIPVATARIELHHKKVDPNRLSAEAWIETNQFADVLFKMRDYMTEDLDRQSLVSRKMYIRQSENKRLNNFTTDFDRIASMVTLVKKNAKGQQTKRFISSNPWGPLSGAMLALSLPMIPDQRYAVDVFTGSTRYVFNFKVGKIEKITTQLGTFNAYRVVPGVDYQSDGKLSDSANGIVIWISADERRLPLRAESQAFIGTVRADLIEVSG